MERPIPIGPARRENSYLSVLVLSSLLSACLGALLMFGALRWQFSFDWISTAEAPAWVQAIGSVLAILIAVAVAAFQHASASQQLIDAESRTLVRRLNSVFPYCQDLSNYAKKMLDALLINDPTEAAARWNRYEATVRERLTFIQGLDVLDWNSYWMVSGFRALVEAGDRALRLRGHVPVSATAPSPSVIDAHGEAILMLHTAMKMIENGYREYHSDPREALPGFDDIPSAAKEWLERKFGVSNPSQEAS